ncbi:aldolase/citrate lyase family protein [Crossiella sp. CA-258035]|uniref:DUF6986 family protein n=1 Tax=Crossiella sp. CA-258035 TaxID=2981138 RepID=UPI0024BC97B7|nr:aldolase/citrate lyase family protein [Crossiella sp. CA-258035]WHT18857.1 aldolase/citrate lyase family protein [Crossiella sp. CA-258035]
MDLDAIAGELDRQLSTVDFERDRAYPGDPGGRQPVHTVYVPADRVRPGLAAAWGAQARAALAEHAPDGAALAAATGVDGAAGLRGRVLAKLTAEPIEDLRVDLEDGFGAPGEAEEDAAARSAGRALREDLAAGTAPPFCGVRPKGLEPALRRRGLRSLALLLTELVDGGLPPGFVITFPKVTSAAQVTSAVWLCGRLEQELGLAEGTLRFELQVETTQAILGPDGRATVAEMVHASEGRCAGLHYGTYDYSAACGVTAALQSMAHPVAEHARMVMLLAAAGTGVRLSDGSTNILPVGGSAEVHAGWRLHARLVRRSLDSAYYQGWDLHPHQLPTRFLATYAFYREAFPAAAARLRAYRDRIAGTVLDEPATAQALAIGLVRGLDCGALAAEEVEQAVGAQRAELEVLARRRIG